MRVRRKHRFSSIIPSRRRRGLKKDMESAGLSPMLKPEAAPFTRLQQQVGNRVVNRMLADPTLMRQVDEPAEAEQADIQPINTSGLGREEQLPGHGNTGGGQAGSLPEIQRNGGGSVTANISLTSNPPLEMSLPAADIASNHSRPGVAGWTTPQYDIQVPSASSSQIDINVTMDFDMELAEEYTGDTLRVLRDHEFGHVNIGNQKAQQYLVNNLESNLEAQPALTRTNIQAAINTAANNFVAQEGSGSQAYDAMDYPRMQQAYLGARLPLADLEARSGKIAGMASALRGFNAQGAAASEAQMNDLAQAVLDAGDELSVDEVSQLQYNAGFAALVASCRAKIDEILERFHWDFWIIEFSTLNQDVMRKLEELRSSLNGYTWRSPV